MLRLVVTALLVLNLGYYAWGQGWLLAYGWSPSQQHEPQRVAQQVHPEVITILNDKETSSSDSGPAPQPATSAPNPVASDIPAPVAAATCWQMTDLDAQQAEALRPLLKAKFPEGASVLEEARLSARWMVYMGKYTQPEDLAKKRDQLSQLKVPFSVLSNTAFSPGFSLGVFSSEEAANTALQEVARRGVRSARVVQERPDILRYRLQLYAGGVADQASLSAVKAAVRGKALESCPPAAAGTRVNANAN
jgi:hypothetical protein